MQELFSVPVSETTERNKNAQRLSQPLYVLFRQLDAVCESNAVESKMKVSIVDSLALSTSGQSGDGGSGKRGRAEMEDDGSSRKRSKSSRGSSPGSLSAAQVLQNTPVDEGKHSICHFFCSVLFSPAESY